MNTVQTKTEYPISLDELKRHLNILLSFTDDDTYLSDTIQEGTQVNEQYIDKDIADTTYDVTGDITNVSKLEFPKGFFQSLETITVGGVDIKPTTTVKILVDYFTLEFEQAQTGALVLQFKTGFTAATVKKDLKRACLMKCGELYDADRDNYTSKNIVRSGAVETILNRYMKKIHVSSY